MHPEDKTRALIGTLQKLTRESAVDWSIVDAPPGATETALPATWRFTTSHRGIRFMLFRETGSAERQTGPRSGPTGHVLAVLDCAGRELWRAERAPHLIEKLYSEVRQRLIPVEDLLSTVIDPVLLASAEQDRTARIQALIDGDGLIGWFRRKHRAIRERLSGAKDPAPRWRPHA